MMMMTTNDVLRHGNPMRRSRAGSTTAGVVILLFPSCIYYKLTFHSLNLIRYE